MMLVTALFFSAETDQHENVRQAVVCKRRGFNSVVYGVWLANSLNTSRQQVSGINHVCLTRLRTPVRLERFNPIDFIFDQWLGYELTQTWVRNDRMRKDWIPHPYHRLILVISSFLLNKNLSMVKLVNVAYSMRGLMVGKLPKLTSAGIQNALTTQCGW